MFSFSVSDKILEKKKFLAKIVNPKLAAYIDRKNDVNAIKKAVEDKYGITIVPINLPQEIEITHKSAKIIEFKPRSR